MFDNPELDFDSLSPRQRSVLHDLSAGVPVRNPDVVESLLKNRMVVRYPDGTLSIAPTVEPVYRKWAAGGLHHKSPWSR